jgi:hypothetical protein
VDEKATFERIFKLTGVHLGAAAAGFALAAALYAPKPREHTPLPPRTAQILELRQQARAAASAAPGPALARATELCRALGWPSCDAEAVRQMGQVP